MPGGWRLLRWDERASTVPLRVGENRASSSGSSLRTPGSGSARRDPPAASSALVAGQCLVEGVGVGGGEEAEGRAGRVAAGTGLWTAAGLASGPRGTGGTGRWSPPHRISAVPGLGSQRPGEDLGRGRGGQVVADP